MSLDKVPVFTRISRRSLKDRMNGVSVKLESLPRSWYEETEKINHMGSARKNRKMSLEEPEKDSGFSDTSSDYLSTLEQTDLEDPPSQKRPAVSNHMERTTAVQSSLSSLTPVYIVKNVLLKEPLSVPTRSQLVQAQLQTWGSQHSLGTSGQTRVVFIGQPLAASFKPQKIEAKAGTGKDTYLPILNSYPRIAPHPDKSRDDNSSRGQEGNSPAQDDRTADHSKSKRLCLDELGEPPQEYHRNKQTSHVPPVGHCQQAENTQQTPPFGPAHFYTQFDDSVSPSPVVSPNPVLQSESSESVHSSSSSSSPASTFSHASSAQSLCSDTTRLADRGPRRPVSSPAKERRFRNTVEILSRSGLLEITLKTKDLIRQNNGTQQQIDELKEHVRLFCSAAQSRDPRALLRLQETMKCSGNYASVTSAPSSCSATNQPLQATAEQAPLL
ncbi:CLOCK-interacting pacemaker [Chiloscyllium plagiosum]|uniref:CLOCK-interacting pacemaker n=1 Tax=Chiloscyllium plagiosum TaxID=36176 RepID=UPI001CB7B8D8|nr:CLOCK-interacting pacemaker [Chiloscyllium plagiosum]XP_043536850.1 CLOCK-interacting pacemaker [Chiloscyllium plagiosum]XP_043536851.1 CLOCK-interacting pacemaker [Chiloscyllium plagiosum]